MERVRVVLIVTSGTKMGAQIAKDIVRPSLSHNDHHPPRRHHYQCHSLSFLFHQYVQYVHPLSRSPFPRFSQNHHYYELSRTLTSHPQHHCHPSGGVFQLCPQGMINLVWFSTSGNCVFLFFFLVLLNDPSKSFHHPCFYYNL